MSLQEKLAKLKQDGLTIKFIAKQTNIAEATLYAFSSGQRNLSLEKAEKLEAFLNLFLS